jgi:hypothetical protein
MKFFIKVFLLASITITTINTQQPTESKVLCLTKIKADDRMVGTYSKAHVATPTQATVQVTNGRLLQALQESTTPARVSNLLKAYYSLSSNNQRSVQDCKLNNNGALARCEAKHGTGSCESTGPGLANKKCPRGLKRYGHSLCAVGCPEGWVDRTVDCYKPKGYKSLRFKTRKECRKAHKGCQKFHLSYWVPRCKRGFVRQGADGCIPVCPEGWMDLGRKCIKPTVVNAGDVFVWKNSDN